jgi:hypothetical protein
VVIASPTKATESSKPETKWRAKEDADAQTRLDVPHQSAEHARPLAINVISTSWGLTHRQVARLSGTAVHGPALWIDIIFEFLLLAQTEGNV